MILWMKLSIEDLFKPFVPNAPFFYPLKTSLGTNGLIKVSKAVNYYLKKDLFTIDPWQVPIYAWGDMNNFKS